MKLKIVFVLLCVCIAGLLGIPKYSELTSNQKMIDQVQSEVDISKQTYNDLQNQAAMLVSQLQENGKDVCLNNVDMANYLGTLGTITGITSMGYTDDVLGDIQMTNDIDDIAYFSSDVVQIKYDLDVTDIYSFIEGITEVSPAVVSSNIDIQSGKATVIVRAVTGAYSDISNTGVDLNVMDSEVDMPTEDAVNGLYESTEVSTEP